MLESHSTPKRRSAHAEVVKKDHILEIEGSDFSLGLILVDASDRAVWKTKLESAVQQEPAAPLTREVGSHRRDSLGSRTVKKLSSKAATSSMWPHSLLAVMLM
jgi:hypothetical protein